MNKDAVLIIGSGGREHAIAIAVSKSPSVGKVFCSPGNAGMTNGCELVELPLQNPEEIHAFLKRNSVKLTIIGPEAPLVEGLSDILRKKGHLVMGTSQQSAQLEGSKVFAKNFMSKYDIPTAAYRVFDDPHKAVEFIHQDKERKFSVLKVDGLAQGKGVYVTSSKKELLAAVDEVLVKKRFGKSGDKIILEERLKGPEISVIALTDGHTLLPFPSAQDHKRIGDGDQGPNTGGMGAYAPTPFYSDLVQLAVEKTIIQNFLRGVEGEKLDYRGIIYFGLMLTDHGPFVLEFNVRFGDPETQVILPLIESDIYQAFLAVAEGKLANVGLHRHNRSACTVVLASRGYPGSFEKGYPIRGLEIAQKKRHVVITHAGTTRRGDAVVTSGGRVLNVTGLGKTLDAAVVHAYQAIKKISFENMYYRRDIAGQAIKNPRILSRIKRMKTKDA